MAITKTARERKTEFIKIRVTKEQRSLLERAAHRFGIGVSTWMLTVALADLARRER